MPEPSASFGAELRRRRLAAGLSQDQLSRLAHYSKSQLSKVETGAQKPSLALARQCDAALDASGDLIALVPASRRANRSAATCEAYDGWDMSVRCDGSGAVGSTQPRKAGQIGGPPTTSWPMPSPATGRCSEPLRAAYTAIYQKLRLVGQITAPGVLIPQLVTVTDSLRREAQCATGASRDGLLTLAARFAVYTGWMAQESGDERGAVSWTEYATELARHAGDLELVGYGSVREALVWLYRADSAATVRLAKRAQDVARTPRVAGLAAQREAQGHAIGGDYNQCMRALDRAAGLLSSTSPSQSQPVIGPSTVSDPVAMVTGWCLHDLGRSRHAVEILERELQRLPAGAHRTRARFGARLALALASTHELEHTCTVVDQVLDSSRLVGSATIRVELRFVAKALNRWHREPVVRELSPRLAAAVDDRVGGDQSSDSS